MTRREIGANVRAVRERRGRSLEWVAEQTGLSRSALSRMELGEQAQDAEDLSKIADALDCRASAFYAERAA